MFDWIFGFLSGGLNSVFKGWFDNTGGSDLLPGSSFHAITAAFATQGYWAQADFIYFINETGFHSFAVLIYLCALIAGVVGMAMGAPPKQYLWYFMGPALFHFLLGTTQPVYGTAWKVGGTIDYQFEVWKLAETGLQSTNIAKRDGIKITAYDGPSEPVNVSWFFAQLDGVVSATIETFISWLGVNLLDGQADSSSNTGAPPSADGYNTGGRWHLISNLKWGYLDTIASARLTSPELRDGFINFMAGRCGDEFQASIDAGRYMSAAKSESGSIPAGIFVSTLATTAVSYAEPNNAKDTYKDLDDKMGKTAMPMPIALRKLFPKTSMLQPSGTTTTPGVSEPGSLEAALRKLNATFINPGTAGAAGSSGTPAGYGDLQSIMQRGEISCRNYLDILIKGFRWEAANVYFNLEKQLPPGAKQTYKIGNGIEVSGVLEYAMLYGWEVQKYKVTDLFGDTGSKTFRDKIMEMRGEIVDSKGLNQYLINLIFINMLKNEFLLAPNAMSRKLRLLSNEQSSNAIEMYQKTIGSRNKFGEIYSWARMMPYLQGLLLYILALGYPFACVMILLPRCSKILFTWGSFWIWAKLWDLGFAVVVILERSVWATIGNSAKATQMNPFIVQIADWGITKVGAVTGSNLLPNIEFDDLIHKTGPLTSYMFMDRAMTLFSNMDLDLQNSFYIYIMAALYFAVPAITGQLVLGGKASIAGVITGAFSDMAKETGGKAGAAHQAALGGMMQRAQAVQNRAFALKALTDDSSGMSIIDRALGAQNQAIRGGVLANGMQTEMGGLRNRQNAIADGFRFGTTQLEHQAGLRRMATDPNRAGAFILSQMMMAGDSASPPTKQDIQNGTGSFAAISPAAREALAANPTLWNADGTMNRDALNRLANPVAQAAGGAAAPAGGSGPSQPGGSGGGMPGANGPSIPGGAGSIPSSNGRAGVNMSPGDAFGVGSNMYGAGGVNPSGFGVGNAATQWMGQQAMGMFNVQAETQALYGRNFLDSQNINSGALNNAVTSGLEMQLGSLRSQNDLANASYQREMSLGNGTMQDASLNGQNDFFLQAANTGLLSTYTVSNSGAFSTESSYLAGSNQAGERAFNNFNTTKWGGTDNKQNGAFFQEKDTIFGGLNDRFGQRGILDTYNGVAGQYSNSGVWNKVAENYRDYQSTGGNGVSIWGIDQNSAGSSALYGTGTAVGNRVNGELVIGGNTQVPQESLKFSTPAVPAVPASAGNPAKPAEPAQVYNPVTPRS